MCWTRPRPPASSSVESGFVPAPSWLVNSTISCVCVAGDGVRARRARWCCAVKLPRALRLHSAGSPYFLRRSSAAISRGLFGSTLFRDRCRCACVHASFASSAGYPAVAFSRHAMGAGFPADGPLLRDVGLAWGPPMSPPHPRGWGAFPTSRSRAGACLLRLEPSLRTPRAHTHPRARRACAQVWTRGAGPGPGQRRSRC